MLHTVKFKIEFTVANIIGVQFLGAMGCWVDVVLAVKLILISAAGFYINWKPKVSNFHAIKMHLNVARCIGAASESLTGYAANLS